MGCSSYFYERFPTNEYIGRSLLFSLGFKKARTVLFESFALIQRTTCLSPSPGCMGLRVVKAGEANGLLVLRISMTASCERDVGF